jgi:hypothetical protein
MQIVVGIIIVICLIHLISSGALGVIVRVALAGAALLACVGVAGLMSVHNAEMAARTANPNNESSNAVSQLPPIRYRYTCGDKPC